MGQPIELSDGVVCVLCVVGRVGTKSLYHNALHHSPHTPPQLYDDMILGAVELESGGEMTHTI